MRKIIYVSVAISVFLIASNCSTLKKAHKYYLSPCYYDTPVRQTDFPQVFLNVDLEDYYNQLHILSGDHFTMDTIQTIDYKNQSYPIVRLSRIHGVNEAVNKKLLIFAGVHGNESGGTLAILDLLKEYQKYPALYKGWAIEIITPINPAGALEMSRYNECGCDLNRKVRTSAQKGIRIQREVIEDFQPDVIITMHEAPSEGFLLHSNKYLKDELLFTMLSSVEDRGVVLSTKDYLGRELDVAGNSKVKGGLKFLKNLVQVQTLGDYAAEKGIIEITTESSWNSDDIFQRVNSHSFVVQSLVKSYQK